NTGLILTSPDGVTWTTRVSGVSNWLLDLCHGNNLYVAVGTGGRIITSPDGITWTTQTSGTSDQLYRAAYGDGTYIAVGVNGTILRSSDGADWNADASGVTNSLRGVTYGNGAFLAAGYEGTLLTSGDYEPPAGGAEAEEEGALAVTPAPDGALSNIVVYCSAGHGFTANTNVGGWYVGRSLVNGVVEDMGNVDQINTFVQYCLNAGAAVVPCRPVGYQTNQVILDNDDASVAFTGTWANSSSTIFYGTAGDTPYKYAYISTNGATAGARYTPTIPTGGFYPVYTWVLYSSNRARQLYRIRHSGGINEIRVNHRRVGAGWVWLGTYYFEAGTNGYVDISNYAPGYDPVSDVVIADAIRFGNGMGDINRGWGVSGYEKELEASRYWVQGMTGEGMASTLYDRPTLDDSDDNVGAPTRISDYMDNEADGDFWDRIYLGFHSNADGGAGTTRGAMGLYSTANTAACQARQQAFATALNSEIETDFEYLDNGVGFNDDWTDTSSDVYGSVYGEISEGYNSNMNHTIIEVAYHNNAEDARLLKDPAARLYFSRACFKGLVKHLNANNPSVPLAFLPDPPTAPRAVNVSGGVTVSWTAPATNTASGQSATSYRVYQSTNGYGFGAPTATTNTSVTLTNLAEGSTYYFHVTALNAGGESLPSEVVGVRVSPMGRAYHLVVNGFERFDRGLSPTRYFSGGGIGGG
ncbi:MAG: fibronectin type III domain-containing protein, partial [Verrucomicrobia bacterium]|nr:fibronectin type III domain-containing protein [Verrucomicrobiota bacterium]